MEKYLNEHPDRLPIIIDSRFLQRHKFIVKKNLLFGQFAKVILNNLVQTPENVFFVCGQSLIPFDMSIQSLYDQHRWGDGVLRIELI